MHDNLSDSEQVSVKKKYINIKPTVTYSSL